ncbi:MAG: hypothetical protein A2527_14260 [Candidatus Lambdaproteobacteria bacterium RIFOXYD2_FULL_50_16]|uniref:Uncharacterized protein n=1 Tax=Candidatus Lambdaproteobacteria bacterium RIFOXYD2_FULL_50_16 TaxID=1817772 RepID=A0A1F6G4N9_9PROT|nr:MAG: hypothetical protein A2527_14260 [Candidatus Lambdaproteobacteria bacterium RIFOXYD2_FULL_50_16]
MGGTIDDLNARLDRIEAKIGKLVEALPLLSALADSTERQTATKNQQKNVLAQARAFVKNSKKPDAPL